MLKTKRERLDEAYRRLATLPRCSSFLEMRDQLDRTLNEVEDEWTPFPYAPEAFETANEFRATDRMYPPLDDNMHDVPNHPHVKELRTAGDRVFIGTNGSIEIRPRKRTGATVEPEPRFFKAGQDGRGVWGKAG